MKWNENEIVSHLASRHPDWEGQLSYKAPKSSSTFSMQQQYKERYLKLFGNILVLSKGPKEEQTNIFILEKFTAQIEDRDIFCFSINFQQPESTEKHLFVAVNLRSMNQWLEALKKASLEKLKETLIDLQCKLRSRTGVDPLVGTNLEHNLNFSMSYISGETFKSGNGQETPGCKQKHCEHSSTPSKFTSHIGMQMWEEKQEKECELCNKPVGKSNPTFKSHIEENLIQF